MSAVTDTIAGWLLALDDHDWEAVVACLGDSVRRDYSSLFGAEPDEISGPALVAEWRDTLSGLDSHQHLLGPPVVEVDGHEARAAVQVVATHVAEGDPGSPWVVGGTYRLELRQDAGGWRIVSLTLDTRWQTGDAALLERAAGSAR